MNTSGKHSVLSWAALLLCASAWMQAGGQESKDLQPEAKQLMALANQARAAASAPPLRWDNALAEAALKHTLRMVAEGPIAHQYPGELNVAERAGLTGAHFDLIEENVALASTAAEIHDSWMQSKGHRENLLNPEVDSVGIAVVASRGVLYATADYSRAVMALTQAQVEARVSELIQKAGVMVLAERRLARSACMMNSGMPGSVDTKQPTFLLRWEGSDLAHLPKQLVDHIASRQFHEAAVGSCNAHGDQGAFTSYRVAVLLY
jgi:uncharacterized protein YkwD